MFPAGGIQPSRAGAAMAKKADVRDSDNSWVIAGSEGLPVETLGPEEGELPQAAAEEPVGDTLEVEDEAQDTLPASAHRGKKDEASLLSSAAGREEAEFKDSEEHLTLSPKGGSDAAAHPDELLDIHKPEEPDSQDAGLDSGAGVLGSSLTGRAGALAEEGSGSSSNEDQDVEGLRRRKGRDVPPAPERPAPHRVLEAEGAEGGLGTTTYLLGALALLAVGLLVFSGGVYDLGDSLSESAGAGDAPEGEQPWSPPLPVISIKEQLEQPSSSPSSAGDPQSLQAMSLLLDKLAKENQDIRAMQAVLQAQKDELQALLEKSETEKAVAGSPTPGLAEMAQLRSSLQQEEAVRRAAQAELLQLQRQLEQEAVARGGQQEPAMEQPQAPAPASASYKERLRQELKKQRELLASVQQDLIGALQRAQASGQLEQLQAELGTLEQRLAQELQQSESWEQGWGSEEASEPLPQRSKKPFKAERKEGPRHKARGEPRPGRPGDKVGREPKEPGRPKHHKPRHEPKPGRDWDSPARRVGSRKVPPHGHHVPRAWELPSLSQYQAPQGCSGAAACARQEGLAPVQKAGFLQLLEGFMVQRGWGPHYGRLAAPLDDVFGPDGTFAHDRLRFSDFADHVEDLLEVLAWQEQGNDEAADDFEEFVLQHYGLGPRFQLPEGLTAQKPAWQGAQLGQSMGTWPRHEPKPGRDWDSPARRVGSRKVPPHGHHVPRAWELPSLSQYQAPQGCSGAAACARQEGLAPVQKAGFLQLLEGFMVQRGWGPHYGRLAAPLDDVFGPDGTFAHDRLRFSDFADHVEDLLEVLAWQEQGNDEAADDFEEFVLQHYGLGPSSAREGDRSGPKRHEKESHGHRPPPDHASSHGQEGSSRAQG
ncbi:PREDICTED: pre-B-cell leukemia transcription factor-interacting protein 1 [Gavialis gangeticus]|uniref:pre-B-cell leukemia transcription factor-interacting protein 1 n=1 Tax=Gavialis gangeticus TaxID=94835 RepID=UPI00092FBBA9|nr:PREDICTED: pre-B-cell leukemia transcription factor-interacting protein 1 [Gavialis gangeticus]